MLRLYIFFFSLSSMLVFSAYPVLSPVFPLVSDTQQSVNYFLSMPLKSFVYLFNSNLNNLSISYAVLQRATAQLNLFSTTTTGKAIALSHY